MENGIPKLYSFRASGFFYFKTGGIIYMKGYIQVYTGNGKGKTTAAYGVAVRAIGAGMKVCLVQFIKGLHSSEFNTFKKLSDSIDIFQYGEGNFIFNEPSEKDIYKAKKGLERLKAIIASGKYQVVILDEINMAVYLQIISIEDIIDILANRPENLEVILTGRYAHPKIIEMADLVTEMNEIKHYYKKGVLAREGIEK